MLTRAVHQLRNSYILYRFTGRFALPMAELGAATFLALARFKGHRDTRCIGKVATDCGDLDDYRSGLGVVKLRVRLR